MENSKSEHILKESKIAYSNSKLVGEQFKERDFITGFACGYLVCQGEPTIKSDNSKVIATLQAELEKAKELLREARDWMKEEASIKMRNGANRDVVDSYDDKAYKLTKFLEAKKNRERENQYRMKIKNS